MADIHTTDYQLILRCRNGDEQAFNELYNRYRLPLFSYLHKLLPGRTHLVEDIFQQVWARAIRNFSHYEDQQKFLAWLCRIAYNLSMDHFRRSRESLTTELPDSLSSGQADSAEALRRQELSQAVARAIAGLTEEQREIVNLRLQGLSFREIAESRHLKINTALGRMRYAVLKIRELLQDYI